MQHVSDTALWVATYRARETERADAVFEDRLAGSLAGERGREIAATMPYGDLMAWVLVVRTSAIDRLIRLAVDRGVDTVVNLGAGLDTRPYRMDLPESLRWVEVDLPAIIRFKNEGLAGERPVCELERVEADLSDPAVRRRVLDSIDGSASRVAVVTEGVLPYLDREEVAALSDALLASPTIECWIQDYRQGGRGTALKKLARSLEGAPLRFVVKDWLGFFSERGWEVKDVIYTYDEAKRIDRRPPFIFPLSLVYLARFLASKRLREKAIRENGYVLLEKSRRP